MIKQTIYKIKQRQENKLIQNYFDSATRVALMDEQGINDIPLLKLYLESWKYWEKEYVKKGFKPLSLENFLDKEGNEVGVKKELVKKLENSYNTPSYSAIFEKVFRDYIKQN